MNVLLKSDEIVLYLASHSDIDGTYAWVLSLESYSGPPNRLTQNKRSGRDRKSQRVSKVNSSSSSSSSSSSNSNSNASGSGIHPFAKLHWFKRRPLTEIKKIRAETIYMRVRVGPAFFIHADGAVDNDGYLLSHGLYNFDLRGKNEVVIAIPV